MIQDISPYKLDNTYHETIPVSDDCFFSFRGNEVLLREGEDGRMSIPSFRNLRRPVREMGSRAVFLFCMDTEPLYLLRLQEDVEPESRHLQYFPIEHLEY